MLWRQHLEFHRAGRLSVGLPVLAADRGHPARTTTEYPWRRRTHALRLPRLCRLFLVLRRLREHVAAHGLRPLPRLRSPEPGRRMNAEPQDPASRTGRPATASVAERLGPVLDRMPDPFADQQVNTFQDELAAAYGTRYAVAVSSGTAALHTALVAAGVGFGDEVLVPACTVVMTVAAIALSGARPVFVDAAEPG